MKDFEQTDTLLPNTWIVVRIDGRGFHKLVSSFSFSFLNARLLCFCLLLSLSHIMLSFWFGSLRLIDGLAPIRLSTSLPISISISLTSEKSALCQFSSFYVYTISSFSMDLLTMKKVV